MQIKCLSNGSYSLKSCHFHPLRPQKSSQATCQLAATCASLVMVDLYYKLEWAMVIVGSAKSGYTSGHWAVLKMGSAYRLVEGILVASANCGYTSGQWL